MSCIPRCTVCDAPVANAYAPSARCERCEEPCSTCGKDVAHCQHPLRPLTAEQKVAA